MSCIILGDAVITDYFHLCIYLLISALKKSWSRRNMVEIQGKIRVLSQGIFHDSLKLISLQRHRASDNF